MTPGLRPPLPLRPFSPVLILSSLLPALLFISACGGVREPGTRVLPERSPEVRTATVLGPSGRGLTLVRARIVGVGGERGSWLLLDSGSASVVLPEELVRGLELPLVGEGLVNGGPPVSFHRLPRLDVGPLVLREIVVTSLDWTALRDLAAAFEGSLGDDSTAEGLGGFAGFPLFARAVIEVRFGTAEEGDRVSIHAPESYRLPRGEWHPVRVVDRRPVIEATLGDGRSAALIVDTGTSGGLVLERDFAEAAGLLEGHSLRRERRFVLHGAVPVLAGRLERLELGGRSFRDVGLAVRSSEDRSRGDLPPGVAGLAGRELFEGLTVVFDLGGERLALLDPPTGQ